MQRLAVLASHEGTTLQAVMDACAAGELDAEVVLVISNNSKSGALRRAREAGIEAVHISGKTHPCGEEDTILNRLVHSQASMVLLLGYMKKVGPKVLSSYEGRIINSHPSLLPKFGGAGFFGLAVHDAVLKAGEKETGVTVHRVSSAYDRGEILLQKVVPVVDGDTPESLQNRVKLVEKNAIVEALNTLSC